MNTSTVHSSGALLLEPTNQLVIELKLLLKEPIPLTYNTPVEKIKGMLPVVSLAHIYCSNGYTRSAKSWYISQ